MRRNIDAFVMLGMLLLATRATATEFVVNGGFDLPVVTNGTQSGWTSSDINTVVGGYSATDGNPGGYYWLNNVGAVATDPTIEQTVTGLTPGSQYSLTADYISVAVNYDPAAATDSLVVDLDGSTVFSAGPTASRINFDPVHAWKPVSVCFTAGASSVVLRFRGEHNGSDNDFGIDNVSIVDAPTCPPPPDHFACYKLRRVQPVFGGVPTNPGLTLVDQFGALESGNGIGTKPANRICAPTNKNGEDPSAHLHPDHLVRYGLKAGFHASTPVRDVQIFNQFNPGVAQGGPDGLFLTVKLKKAAHILVPTAKDLSTTPPAPSGFVTDHFVCYAVGITKDMPKFAPQQVTLHDQFDEALGQSKTALVRKPTFLCAPANKNGEDPTAQDHVPHLVCYSLRQIGTKFPGVSGIHTQNQFAAETFDVRTPVELCVPSTKVLLP